METTITFEVETELLKQVQALCDQRGTTIEIIVNRFLIALVNNENWAIELLKSERRDEK